MAEMVPIDMTNVQQVLAADLSVKSQCLSCHSGKAQVNILAKKQIGDPVTLEVCQTITAWRMDMHGCHLKNQTSKG